MLRYMRRAGITSHMLYTAGMGSIAISMAAWLMSMRFESAGADRADRWGIFVGEWAPTFFAMGIAMRLEEEWAEEDEYEAAGGPTRRRARDAMPVR
jgi:hypothetical protein